MLVNVNTVEYCICEAYLLVHLLSHFLFRVISGLTGLKELTYPQSNYQGTY